MKKKQGDEGTPEAGQADEGAASRRPAAKKKPAAKKPPAKKKPVAKKPRGKQEPIAVEPADVTDVALHAIEPADLDDDDDDDDDDDEDFSDIAAAADVVDAEIVAETPRDLTEETAAVETSPLSEEERALTAIYGDDLSAPATAHAEYQDRQTADEDRPMLPEINARDERKRGWEERRERRKSRRDERDRDRQQRRDDQRGRPADARPADQGRPQGQPHGQPSHQLPPRPQMQLQMPVRSDQPATQVNGHEPDGLARVGTPLGDAAAAVFAQLRNSQPLPVRQLAAMMRKRSLVQQDAEQLWPQLKAELLGDERSYRALGLRPRIVYRGRDLFAPGPVAMSVTADAEAGVANALSRLQSATHRALATRLAKANPAGFERLIHAYLVAAGYKDIEWVKRTGGISYATATAPGLGRMVLLSARSGDQPIDRRGIGELRVGVEAKNLVAGILYSARELSEDAEKELERAGRSVAVVCGDQLVAALVHAGVGVVSAAAPLHYLDDQLLDELLAG